MATAAAKAWRWDWAGPHGTIWGTINGILTPLAAATVGHWWGYRAAGAPRAAVCAATVIAGAVAIIAVLARVSVTGGATRVTMAYRIGCWGYATLWTTVALHEPRWTGQGVTAYVLALVIPGLLAGGIATLATQPTTDDQPPPTTTNTTGRIDPAPWEELLTRATGVTGLTVLGVEPFQNRAAGGAAVGRYVEVRIPDGPLSWKAIAAKDEQITNILGLGPGCVARTGMGVDRKHAIVAITEVNVLAEEQPYPDDHGPLTIHEPIPMMTSADGTPTGPTLREHCAGIFGEAGSGKSNTAQVVGAGIARMGDALLCDIDCTGGRLSGPLLRPWLDGRATRPAVWWAATDPTEAWLLLRALQRIAIARNNGYGDLCAQVDDDKVPISEHIPQLVLRGDEIAKFASINPVDPGILPPTDHRYSTLPDLHQLIQSLVYDDRAAGVRCVLFGLRGTNDVISQDVQSQLHAIGVLKATSLAEYRCVFGANPPCDPADAPWPGCIQMRRSTDDPIAPYHVWRIKPSQLDRIAVAVADRQPGLDELSLLAANGRAPDGTPFDDLYPGELDCCDTRWDRYLAKHGGRPSAPPERRPSTTPTTEENAVDHDIPTTDLTMERALTELAATTEALRRRVEEVSGARPDDEDRDEVDPDVWERIVQAATGPAASWRDLASAAIGAAGAAGISPKGILAALAQHGVVVHRDTLHSWLTDELSAGRLVKPRNGRWARP